MTLPIKAPWSAVLCLLAFVSWSCNERPVVPLDQALNSSSAQQITIGAKTKIDILFVIDASGSMADEQMSLVENFNTFSSFIFDDLNNAVDYRIAVTSTGLNPENTIFPASLGRFTDCPNAMTSVLSPASVQAQSGCGPEDVECLRPALASQFSCLAGVGTEGINNERGLEAMRSALSCNGPNAHQFGRCCQADSLGRLNFDPLCRGGGEEANFLRPDAFLTVVFITDEDDCSTYASSGVDAPFATCRVDAEQLYLMLGDGTEASRMAASTMILDSYSRSPDVCADPNSCYTAECTDASGALVDPVDCYYARCDLDLRDIPTSDLRFGNACRWQGHKLAPVEYYFSFLNQLKARPTEQLLVANIVAPGKLTDTGHRLVFSENDPVSQECVNGDARDYNMCCPNGQCGAINDVRSCQNNAAGGGGYSSWRYIDLMTMFGDNGLGCREGQVDGCVNICNADLSQALQEIREKVVNAVGDYCVARRPACLVTDPMTGESRPCITECADPVTGGLRPCAEGELSPEESVASYYQLRLKQTCQIGPPAGACGDVGAVNYLNLGTDYELDVNDPSCQSGVRVELKIPPTAGSVTDMELLQSILEFNE